MYCKMCGKEVDDSFAYCPNCGEKINLEPLKDSNRSEPFTNVPLDKEVNHNKASFWWVILGIICPIAGLIIYIVKVNEFPNMAKKSVIGTIIGFVIYLLLFIAFLTIWIVAIQTGEPVMGGVLF